MSDISETNDMLDVTLRLLTDDASPAPLPAAADDLALLRRGLVAEPELRGRVRLVTGGPEEGQMGTGIELLAIAIGSSGAVTALVRSLPALLKARRAAATVELTLPDGRTVKVTADSADDAHTLLDAALRDHRQP
ncbi:hypothetical protein SAMN04487980_101996 [Streptomyces sp. cf124]|uniref:effector-associated constant component EACC1 n=1 Tax=Streptomyces TaxID=1883 RepID=UPI000765B8D8|nr:MULTISPECIES: hypothetical protein [Streptomyces]SFN41641.1 hypothetical protein SAMN04487980_101996 [Streptomyces sp. cf124]